MAGRKIVVLGGAESGVGAALLAIKNKEEVFLSDYGVIKDSFKEELLNNKIRFEEGGHDFENIENADLVVKSPGIPEKSAVVQKLRELKIPIISEIEYGYQYFDGKVIGITGSNGKTTTTGLIHHLLKEAGRDVLIGGNYGTSFCRQLVDRQPEIAVLEISSFQLDDIETFKPDIGVLLNITPDHLDRYQNNFENYINAKFALVKNQNQEGLLIVNGDDQEIKKKLKEKIGGQRVKEVERDQYINGISSKDGNFKLTLKGEHNLFNSLCAIEVARALDLTDDEIQMGLLSFENAPHRLESVGLLDGVEYINDSKATNVDASYYALKAMDKDVVWIAGGVDKGNDYNLLEPLLDKVKVLICLGVDNDKLIEHFRNKIEIITVARDIPTCIAKATSLAFSGEVVLLTPACASFDLFENYIDRGDQFRREVKRLINK